MQDKKSITPKNSSLFSSLDSLNCVGSFHPGAFLEGSPMKRVFALFLITGLIVTGLFSVTVTGASIKFYDESLTGPSTLTVYNVSGEYIGEFNTTSSIPIDESGLIIHFLPTQADLIKDPESLFNAFMDFISANFIYLLAFVALVALIWRK